MIEREQEEAINQFVRGACAPLLISQNGRAVIAGTSTAFGIANRLFLMTAAHVVQTVIDAGLDIASIGVPASSDARHGASVIPLSHCKVTRHDGGDPDIAIIEILDEGIRAQIHKGWTVLALANVEAPSMSPNAEVIVAGYPWMLSRLRGEKDIGGRLILNRTSYIAEQIETIEPVDSVIDILLKYNRHMVRSEEDDTVMPLKLDGISGCSIWEVVEVSSSIWTAEEAVRIVGIEHRYVDDRYMRGAQWTAIARVLMRMGPDLEDAVWARAGGRP